MAPPPSPAGGPLRNDGGLGLGGRHPSKLSMSGRGTRLRSPFKVKGTNGRSVVGTRVWLPRSSPFTSGRVYGLPDSRVYGFQIVSPYWRESARTGRLPACLGGDLDISGARETSLRQNNLLGAKVRLPEPGKVTLVQGRLLRGREAYFAIGKFTLPSGSLLCHREVYFAVGKLTLPSGSLLCRREAYFAVGKLTLPSGSLLCHREAYFAVGKLTLPSGKSRVDRLLPAGPEPAAPYSSPNGFAG